MLKIREIKVTSTSCLKIVTRKEVIFNTYAHFYKHISEALSFPEFNQKSSS